jgi:RNA polymerase sigma-70 factor (ECF subfamily)
VGTEWNNLASAQVESDEFFTVFDRCKNQLKGNAFLAFTLKFIDELETEEICKELGISPTNFWVIIHRAKLAMRHCLDTNWFKTL